MKILIFAGNNIVLPNVGVTVHFELVFVSHCQLVRVHEGLLDLFIHLGKFSIESPVLGAVQHVL